MSLYIIVIFYKKYIIICQSNLLTCQNNYVDVKLHKWSYLKLNVAYSNVKKHFRDMSDRNVLCNLVTE